MPFVELDGRKIETRAGDTIASALWRAGVRVFSRSFKYRRPRGLYCLTGDCPNCLLSVDGEPSVRACCTLARDGQRIRRDVGWPSAEQDIFSVFWRLGHLLPVGSYYKTFLRPRALWPMAERVLRRFAGVGRVPVEMRPSKKPAIHHRPDLLVVGGGLAGLAATLAASENGEKVLLVDEHAIGEKVAPGAVRDRIAQLRTAVASRAGVTILERAAAIGIYEGPLVPVAAPDFLHQVHPGRIVVATGAVERHAVFHRSDLPGVWLGRGAARLAGVHGVSPGRRLVFAGTTRESLAHLQTLVQSSTSVVAALLPQELVPTAPPGIRVIAEGVVIEARGRKQVRSVIVQSAAGREAIGCDAVVLSLGLQPRDGLLRQAAVGARVLGAGEVLGEMAPADAEESGRLAGRGIGGPAAQVQLPSPAAAGYVCLCEDVTVKELEGSWAEGYRSTQILKRYAKPTTGPCQGAMCHAHLRAFVAAQSDDDWSSGPTTARPPIRSFRMEDAAAGMYHLSEQRTALHERHVAAGARMELAGPWMRPQTYGDTTAEYWAVRRGVSIMDVGTLGKYLVTGRDAMEFLERLYPCHVRDIAEGRLRYALLLNEGGYVIDDGLIGSLGPAGFYCTFTSSASDGIESWLRDWIDAWKVKVHVVNHTGGFGAINVAGPKARELLQRLTDDPIDGKSLPYSRHREITVAGVPCRALRVGFVGELSIELHHPRSQSVGLWDALLGAGKDLDIQPHGLDALRLLRLEKGHILMGQDTDFDTTPSKLALDWAVKLDKPYFVGKTALQRIATTTMFQRLAPMVFDGTAAPVEGSALSAEGCAVGYLTSSRFSPVLQRGVGLGWIRRVNGEFPATVHAEGMVGTVTSGPFYDPAGAKLRA